MCASGGCAVHAPRVMARGRAGRLRRGQRARSRGEHYGWPKCDLGEHGVFLLVGVRFVDRTVQSISLASRKINDRTVQSQRCDRATVGIRTVFQLPRINPEWFQEREEPPYSEISACGLRSPTTRHEDSAMLSALRKPAVAAGHVLGGIRLLTRTREAGGSRAVISMPDVWHWKPPVH